MEMQWIDTFNEAYNYIKTKKIQLESWSFGGGTVLSYLYNHRISKDIDIFVKDPQYLAYLSPKFDEDYDDFIEMSNFIKIKTVNNEIDFILSKQITNLLPIKNKICNKKCFVDSPVEIVARKMYYRSDSFKPRDYFDLATVFYNEGEGFINEISMLKKKIQTIKERLNILLNNNFFDDISSISVLNQGLIIKNNIIDICNNFFNKALSSTANTQRQNYLKLKNGQLYIPKITDEMSEIAFQTENQNFDEQRDIEKCLENPYYIANVPFESQTYKIVYAMCEGCKNFDGLDPSNLKKYINNDLKYIVDDYRGHWELGMNNVWYWYDT